MAKSTSTDLSTAFTNLERIELNVDEEQEFFLDENETSGTETQFLINTKTEIPETRKKFSTCFRIVDVKYLAPMLLEKQRNHTKSGCDGIYKIIKEEGDGLRSRFTFSCNPCGNKFDCNTIDEQQTCTNIAAVAATRECGLTHTTAVDFFKRIGIPFMSYQKYYNVAIKLKNESETPPVEDDSNSDSSNDLSEDLSE